VLYYDYVLTFSTEYDQFWKHQTKLTPVNILFALNRYISLLGEIPIMFYQFGSFDTKSCHLLQLYHQSFAVAAQCFVAGRLIAQARITVRVHEYDHPMLALLAIRIFAFYGRGKVILASAKRPASGAVWRVWQQSDGLTRLRASGALATHFVPRCPPDCQTASDRQTSSDRQTASDKGTIFRSLHY